ncbi:MAG TPA: hypothetical protein DDZ83_11495 [Nitrospinae bacterium]|nr:hypothetical protein [Nitrospinota bacterium]
MTFENQAKSRIFIVVDSNDSIYKGSFLCPPSRFHIDRNPHTHAPIQSVKLLHIRGWGSFFLCRPGAHRRNHRQKYDQPHRSLHGHISFQRENPFKKANQTKDAPIHSSRRAGIPVREIKII